MDQKDTANRATIHIRDMVCPRCIRIIKEQFARLELPVIEVQLGYVELARPLEPEEKENVKEVLEDYGFELLEDRKLKLVEQIKTLLIDLIHYTEEKVKTNYSTYLGQAIGKIIVPLAMLFLP